MALAGLESRQRRLWQAIRDQVVASSAARRDLERLRGVLADRRARSDEFFARAAGQWDRLRAELFGERVELLPLVGLLEPGWAVGDLGCGTGHLAWAVAPFVRQVIAVDGSAAMLRGARARLGALANVELRKGDLEALPIESGSLDVAFLVLVLPYSAAPGAVIAEAARTLAPGGRLVVTDLLPHDRAEYRQTLRHLWLGFGEQQVRNWFTEAGLEPVAFGPLPPEPRAKGPMLFTGAGRKGAVGERATG
jgi:ArsR family transcriptional regulator